jgi:multimeric flavodoxin WrbA
MTKILVLYYSAYGHIEAMAQAVAEGARSAGAAIDIKRVPETVPDEIAKASHFKLDQAAQIAKIDDLVGYGAIIIGAGTRFGRVSSQMASFLDQVGGLWLRGALNGKVGGVFTSSATHHGGQPPRPMRMPARPASSSRPISSFPPQGCWPLVGLQKRTSVDQQLRQAVLRDEGGVSAHRCHQPRRSH